MGSVFKSAVAMTAFFDGASDIGRPDAAAFVGFGQCAGFDGYILDPLDLCGQFVTFPGPAGRLTQQLADGPVIKRDAGT